PFAVQGKADSPPWATRSRPERGIRGTPGPAEREPLRCRRMAEEEDVYEARRLEVREVGARELQGGAGESRRRAGQVGRAAGGGTLEAAREPCARSQGRELENKEQQQSLRQRARIRHPGSKHRPENEYGESGTSHREQRQLRDVAVAPMSQLVRDD